VSRERVARANIAVAAPQVSSGEVVVSA